MTFIFQEDDGAISDREANFFSQPHTVLRTATLQEWIDEIKSDGGNLSQDEIAVACSAFFYDISVD